MKSCFKPVADFKFNLKSLQSVKRFYLKKYLIDNRQKCMNCVEPRSNKNELKCKKYDCNYFYAP